MSELCETQIKEIYTVFIFRCDDGFFYWYDKAGICTTPFLDRVAAYEYAKWCHLMTGKPIDALAICTGYPTHLTPERVRMLNRPVSLS